MEVMRWDLAEMLFSDMDDIDSEMPSGRFRDECRAMDGACGFF